jgi:hypothetical protein
MRKLKIIEHISLDGVIQSSGEILQRPSNIHNHSPKSLPAISINVRGPGKILSPTKNLQRLC